MQSVTTEAAIQTSHALLRLKAAPDSSAPSSGFSALVDSNPAAASSSDNHQPGDRTTASARDDGTSPTGEPQGRGKSSAAARGASMQADNAKSDSSRSGASAVDTAPPPQTADGTNADPAASVPATTTDVVLATLVAQDNQAQTGTKDGKAAAKTDGTDAAATADGVQQPMQTTPAMTIVIAVVVDPGSSAGTQAAAQATNGQLSVAVVAVAAGAPGAIAAAAANKVAADIGSTASAPGGTAVAVSPGDTATQIQVPLLVSRSGTQAADPASGPATVSTPAAGGTNGVVQAEVLAPPATLTQLVPQPPQPAKGGKAGATVLDSKVGANTALQPVTADPQAGAPAPDSNARPATEPAAPKKVGTGPQDHDGSVDTSAKPNTDADIASAPAVHQHAAVVESQVAQSSIPGSSALDASTASQASAANTAAAAATTPTNAPLVNVANLTVAMGQAVPLNGLAVEISANARAGNSRFEIRLDPPDLGRIDVRLDVDRNGQVTSRLFVEKSETLDLLRRDAPQLQQALQDAGLKTSDNGLQFSLRDQNPQQGRGDGNGAGQNPQRLVITEEDSSTAGRSYGRSLSASGGVDIRV